MIAIWATLGAWVCVQGHEIDSMRHWEIASPDPDRIVLTWTGNPARTQAVTWRTDNTVDVGYAELALADPSARFDLKAVRHEAVSQSLNIAEHDQNAPFVTRFHSVEFKGLWPDTLYAYRVGDGNQRWSEWLQFRTASTKKGASGIPLFRRCPECGAIPLVENHAGGFSEGALRGFFYPRGRFDQSGPSRSRMGRMV